MISRSCGELKNKVAGADRNDTNGIVSAQSREKPIIMWYHSGEQTSMLPLKTALSSGLITHVFINYRRRSDGPWYAERRVREAIKVVKKSDAKLVWGRTLWAWYKIENSRYSDLFDPSHYIREIQNVKAEAKAIGADFTALDAEAYGVSPIRAYLIGKNRLRLNKEQKKRLKLVIDKAIKVAGKVDFIAPAGSTNHDSPYNFIAELGKNRIAERTYYDNLRTINYLKYPYQIFGMYVKISKENKDKPHNPYFLVPEIFERSELWSNRKGVLIYSRTSESLAVAKELAAYSKTLPFQD